MRTTITIDDDVALMLQRLQAERKEPFRRVLNEVLRRGLLEEESGSAPRELYSTPVLDAGSPRYADLDNVAEILAVAEREGFT